MTLEETIKDYEYKYIQELEKAEEVKCLYGKLSKGYRKHCQFANEYKQFLDWFKELKIYRTENLKN